MVKFLITKRKDKNLTVEQFWDHKAKLSAVQPQGSHIFAPEDEVIRRHRHVRHKDLVNNFDPLETLNEQVPEPESTYTFDLMDKLQTMPKQLGKTRSMCLTLPLIIHNLEKIYGVLFNNLDLDDSWEFIITVIRDTKQESFTHITKRLGQLMFGIGEGFNQKYFKKIFEVMSVFYQSCFVGIENNLEVLWQQLGKTMFVSENKYMRRFSASSFRYILDRLTQDAYNNFVDHLNKQTPEELQVQAVSEAMFSQLRFINKYLTKESISKFTKMWSRLSDEVLTSMLDKLINRMCLKVNRHDLVFDLSDLSMLVVAKSQSNYQCSGRYFVGLLTKHHEARSHPKILSLLNQLMTSILQCGKAPSSLNHLLAITLSINNKMHNKELQHLKSLETQQKIGFLELISRQLKRPSRELLGTLVVLFLKEIKEFIHTGEHLEAVYRLTLLLQTHDFREKLLLSEVTGAILNCLGDYNYERTLVTVKMLKLVQVPQNLLDTLSYALKGLTDTVNQQIVAYARQLPLEVFVVFNYEFPTIHRLMALKQEIEGLCQTHGIAFDQEQLIDVLYRNDESESLYMALRSRVREARLRNLHRFQARIRPSLYQSLCRIDSQKVDIHNQREVKTAFIQIPEGLEGSQVPIVFNWALGFAFTGFRDIEDSFIEFLGKLLQKHLPALREHLLHFLEFMNRRMSRKFRCNIQQFTNENKTPIDNLDSQNFIQMLHQDHPIQKNEAIEKVGYVRVTKALSTHPKIRSLLAQQLTQLLNKYFQEDFYNDRLQMELATEQEQTDIPLKQPGPHPHHLTLMLDLVPPKYMPPYQCLHYSEEACAIFEARGLKSHSWQKQWNKSKKVVQNASSLLQLPKEEHRIYLHFLWRLVLSSNEADRDRIFDHLNQTNLDIKYLLKIHYSQLFLDEDRIEQMPPNDLIRHLSLLQQSKILSFQHICKSFIKKFSYRMVDHLTTLTQTILAIIRLGESHFPNSSANYKLTSKQSPKVLLLIYDTFHAEFMDTDVVQKVEFVTYKILNALQDKIKNLGQLVSYGVPGVLRLLEAWSKQPHLHKVFTNHIVQSLTQTYKYQVIYEESLRLINNIFINLLENSETLDCIKSNSSLILDGLCNNITKSHRRLSDQDIKMIGHLADHATGIESRFLDMFISEIVASMKTRKKITLTRERRSELLDTLVKMSGKTKDNGGVGSIKNLLYYLPEFQDQQQQRLRTIISNSLGIAKHIVEVVDMISATKTKGLVVQPDYDKVFEGINQLKLILPTATVLQKEYIVFNILSLGKNQEVSLVNNFLSILRVFVNSLDTSDENFYLLRRITKAVLSLLLIFSKSPQIFKVYIQAIDQILLYVSGTQLDIGILNRQVARLANQDPEKDFFKLIVSLSQAKKLKALNILKTRFSEWVITEEKPGFPNLMLDLLLVIIEHMVNKKDSVGNLSSSLTLLSTKVYGELYRFLEPSQIKQQLKRLMRGIKFQENTSRNLVVVKMISEILDHIQVQQNALPAVSKVIREQGVDSLHINLANEEDNQIEQVNYEMEQAMDIEKNYARYDKKLIDTQVNENQAQDTSPLLTFLRKHVLVNLKSLLFFRLRTSSNNKKDKEEKGRTFLTVVITKLLVKMGIRTFLIEFNKVVVKLCRLLKSKDDASRENARKSLAQVLKITGPQLIYVVIRQMKFQLKQDFQRHVLNYSIYNILDQLPLEGGSLDYCIPLIIPCAFSEAVGVLAQQKQLVDANQMPTKVSEMKKKKGMLLFKLIGKVISVSKINYLITALKQEFNKHGVTENNSDKFNEIIEHILAGFGKNETLERNSKTLIDLFSGVIELSLVQITNESLTQNTVRSDKRHSRMTARKTYQIQDQAAQGRSIFKKMNSQLKLKQNKKELEYMVYNFWLSLLQISIKKGIINEAVLVENTKLARNVNKFLVSCILGIDNRVVSKSLKIVQSMIRWKGVISKQEVQTNIIENFDRLTSGDETLIRVNLKILIVTYNQLQLQTFQLKRLFTFIELYIQDDVLEALQLFRAVLQKEPFRAEIADLIPGIRQRMISSYDIDIKKICKEVYTSYLIKVVSSQSNLLEEGINYILVNTQCNEETSRMIMLEALESMINWLVIHNKTTFLYFSTIVFYQLVANYANESQQEIKNKIVKIQLSVCQHIDKSKLKEYVHHSVCWIKENQEGLVFNGLNTLNVLADKYIDLIMTHELPSIMEVISYILTTQSNKLQLYYQEQKEQKIKEKKSAQSSDWAQILDNSTTTFNVSYCLPVCLQLANKLKLLESQGIRDSVWVLCSHPVKQIHARCMQLSSQIQVLIDDQPFQQWLRANISNMVRLLCSESIGYLIDIVESFRKRKQAQLVTLVLVDIRKTVHQYIKKIETGIIQVKYLAELLFRLTEREDLLQYLNNTSQQTLFEIVCKFLNQRQKISSLDQSVNEFVQNTSENLKRLITPAAFFKIVSDMKRRQRQVRDVRKAQISQLAVTNPEQYHKYRISRNKRNKPVTN